MDSEWVMAVRRLCLETLKHKKRKKKPDTDKPDTETCDTNNAKKLCVKVCCKEDVEEDVFQPRAGTRLQLQFVAIQTWPT